MLGRTMTAGALGAVFFVLSGISGAEESTDPDQAQTPLQWHSDYREACQEATRRQRMLLLYFQASEPSIVAQEVEERLASDGSLREKLREFVLVKVSTEEELAVDDVPVKLLEHEAFREMHGQEGVAVLDMAHEGETYYGHVVSAFPFISAKYYQFDSDHLEAVLDLPAGTITQRSMIWAVRTHPELPQSTRGDQNLVLTTEATQHSRYQASIGLQGHHRWETRFHRIRQLLGGKRVPVEVVAESWPQQTMIDSCVDCVASWRQSEGHWKAVVSHQASYGYDIHRGSNGIWYGTGLFAN